MTTSQVVKTLEDHYIGNSKATVDFKYLQYTRSHTLGNHLKRLWKSLEVSLKTFMMIQSFSKFSEIVSKVFLEKTDGQKLWNLLWKNSSLAKTTFTRREVDTTRSWKSKAFPWPVGPQAMSEIFLPCQSSPQSLHISETAVLVILQTR